MSDLKNDRENVVFWRNLHHWQKFYTAAGSDGSDKLRYESSTLKLYKELSSTIFQSCEWVRPSGMRDTLPNLHFLQYIKAWMSSTDPVSSTTDRLIVSYTDPVHSFIIS